MKILFFGDTFGKPGRKAVKAAIQKLVPRYGVDFVVMNGENCSHGAGILPEMAEEFFSLGVDVITTGNHAWDQKKIIPYMDKEPRILRPLNYPTYEEFRPPGQGVRIIRNSQKSSTQAAPLAVLQVMGRVFMDALDCPFQVADREVRRLRQEGVVHIIVDFHGEASSEKQAFAYFMDGKASAVLGTHCHVQTADEKILPQGTATITDVGMCGCFDSVIGVKKERIIERFLTKRPISFEPAEGPGGYCAVLLELDPSTGSAVQIQRLHERIVSE